MKKIFNLLVIKFLLFLPLVSCATSNVSVESIVASDQPPPGVVIEIVTGDRDGLNWALPLVRSHIKKLRNRFPDLPISIVTHGREQFALQSDKDKSQKKVHSLTQVLKKDNVQLHLCGTFAGWEGLTEEDFPDYVDVSPSGPAQINDYLALDYKLVLINSRSRRN